MAETDNYKLFLTDDSKMNFIDWREKMNGQTDSNMTKVEAALTALQEAIDSGGAMFAAEYGVTAYDEITAAIEAGKTCVAVDSSGYVGGYSYGTATAHYFIRLYAGSPSNIAYWSCLASGWTTTTMSLERAANKTNTLSTSSTTTQYPNAKIVYDSLLTKLDLSGGTMTGALTLAADPTTDLGAATKQYVDNTLTTALGDIEAALSAL